MEIVGPDPWCRHTSRRQCAITECGLAGAHGTVADTDGGGSLSCEMKLNPKTAFLSGDRNETSGQNSNVAFLVVTRLAFK